MRKTAIVSLVQERYDSSHRVDYYLQVALIEAIRLTFDCYFMFSEVYQKYDIRTLTFTAAVLR